MGAVGSPLTVPEADDEIRESAAQLIELCRRKPRVMKTKSISDGPWEKARRQAAEMIRSGHWEDAIPRHFVAAYAILHEMVYGVAPAELTPVSRLRAARTASLCLQREFGDDAAEMADFLRWTWTREREREKWRRANGREGGRIGVYLQFGALVTDYRLAIARKAGA